MANCGTQKHSLHMVISAFLDETQNKSLIKLIRNEMKKTNKWTNKNSTKRSTCLFTSTFNCFDGRQNLYQLIYEHWTHTTRHFIVLAIQRVQGFKLLSKLVLIKSSTSTTQTKRAKKGKEPENQMNFFLYFFRYTLCFYPWICVLELLKIIESNGDILYRR